MRNAQFLMIFNISREYKVLLKVYILIIYIYIYIYIVVVVVFYAAFHSPGLWRGRVRGGSFRRAPLGLDLDAGGSLPPKDGSGTNWASSPSVCRT